jgi:pseudouridine kinase
MGEKTLVGAAKKTCIFCDNAEIRSFSVREKLYHRCPACGGIFLDRSQLLSSEAEKARYALHENTLENDGYRMYLENCIDEILGFGLLGEYWSPARTILDWGSGPEPSLVRLLASRGHDARGYDPYFAPDVPLEPETADMITCIEVAEHFTSPQEDFARASAYLAKGGFFAVRTGLLKYHGDVPYTDDSEIENFFSSWWYREDPTHISFYTERALVAATARARLTLAGFASKDIAILRKI